MKIALITLHAVKNYGSVLQAIATQKIFEEYGNDVEIIDYVRKDITDSELLNTWCGNNIVKKMILYPSYLKWKKVFDEYTHQILNLTPYQYTSEADFEKNPVNADIYCTGSDQVWNSKWNKGIEYPLYLKFAPDNSLKFAYAASFGADCISESEVKKTQDLISKYQFISVREKSGKNILEKQYNFQNAVQLLDPTLSMSKEFWQEYETKLKIKEDYILIYNLNRSKEFDKYAKQLSKKTGLKLVRICTRYDQIYRVGKSILIPSIPDFIGLIDRAKYVLTDSFHATAFSMNMGTEPICVYPYEFSGRLNSFLQLVEEEQRHIKDFEDFDVIHRKVDFLKVQSILDKERCQMHRFLESVFEYYKEKVRN